MFLLLWSVKLIELNEFFLHGIKFKRLNNLKKLRAPTICS